MDKLNSLVFDTCAGLYIGCPILMDNQQIIDSRRSTIGVNIIVAPDEYQTIHSDSRDRSYRAHTRPCALSYKSRVMIKRLNQVIQLYTSRESYISRKESNTQIIKCAILVVVFTDTLVIVRYGKCTCTYEVEQLSSIRY